MEASWEETERDGSRVLTLERLIQLTLDASRRVELHIETKHPTRYGGLVEKSLVELLERYDLAHPAADPLVTVMSFAPTSLRRMHAMAPELPTVYLMERVPLRWRDGMLPPRIHIAGPSLEIVKAHPHYVERVHTAGNRIHVWTVNEEADIKLMLELGVDAVISNHPRRVRRQVDER
jgi:glycerophosphoryl diester phosphodiesterase